MKSHPNIQNIPIRTEEGKRIKEALLNQMYQKEQAPAKRGPGDHVTESNDDMQVYGY